MLSPDHVQFGGEIHVPEVPELNCTVSNSAGGLRIDGVFYGLAGPQYVPTALAHSNLVAYLVAPVPIPTLSLPWRSASGAVEFSVFNGQAGQTNVIQASTDLVT